MTTITLNIKTRTLSKTNNIKTNARHAQALEVTDEKTNSNNFKIFFTQPKL